MGLEDFHERASSTVHGPNRRFDIEDRHLGWSEG